MKKVIENRSFRQGGGRERAMHVCTHIGTTFLNTRKPLKRGCTLENVDSLCNLGNFLAHFVLLSSRT